MEQISKCALAIRSLEDIGLLNFHPRQLAALFSKFVELMRNLLLFHEQRSACGKPFLTRDDFRWGKGVCRHNQDSYGCRLLNVGTRRPVPGLPSNVTRCAA